MSYKLPIMDEVFESDEEGLFDEAASPKKAKNKKPKKKFYKKGK